MHPNYWERSKDRTLPLLPEKIESLTCQPDSPGPQGTADQPLNLQPEPTVERLRDAQSRKDLYQRHKEVKIEGTEDGRTEGGTRMKILNLKLSKFSVLVVFKSVDPA